VVKRLFSLKKKREKKFLLIGSEEAVEDETTIQEHCSPRKDHPEIRPFIFVLASYA